VRTTLTLDPDLVVKLKAEMRRTGRSFKEVVNDRLRLGLMAKRAGPTERFIVKGKSMGTLPGLDYDNITDLIERVEGPLAR
jgi:hypothetical protein